MKRYCNVLIVILVMVFSGVCFAGNDENNSGNSNQNNNSVDIENNTGAQAIIAPVTKDNISVGMPTIIPQGSGAADIPLDTYGILPGQMSSGQLMEVIPGMNSQEYQTYISGMSAALGEKDFERWQGNIVVRPAVLNPYPSTNEVRFLASLPEGTTFKVVAVLTPYVKKVHKKIPPIFRQEILFATFPSATKYGADVVMTGMDFCRLHLIPEGRSFGIAGLFEAVLKVNGYPGVGGASPHYAAASHRNTVDADISSTYYALKILSIPEPAPAAPPVDDCEEIRRQIREFEEKVRKCKMFCFDNLTYRRALGNLNIDLYLCTGDQMYLETAISHFEIAERNYQRGHDIKENKSEAEKIMAEVYFHWSGCIYALQGWDATDMFAREKNLEKFCTGFAK